MKQQLFIFVLCAQLFSAPAYAQILIGQSAGVTGPVSAGVAETTAGAQLLFDDVNSKGGIFGQKIQLIQKDDQFKPEITFKNAETLIVNDNVLALFLVRGTPHSQAVLPLLEKHNVPLVAPSTGAMVLHQPVNKYVFNVRSTYQYEAAKTIELLKSMAISTIAIVHVDDSFGKDALIGYTEGFATAKLNPVFTESYDRQKPDFSKFIATTKKLQPNAIVIAGSGNTVVDAVTALRKSGWTGMIATLSNNASSGFIKSLGSYGAGIIVSQVFPHERSMSSELIREITPLANKANMPVSPSILEGYAAAKVLVQALKNTGPNPTRAKLLKSLNSLKMNIGELPLSYSETDHSGLVYVDLSIITDKGLFRR